MSTGKTSNRTDWYSMTDTSDGTRVSWKGRDKTNPHMTIMGWLERDSAGGTVYDERFFNDDRPFLQLESQCRPIAQPPPP
jgi:hypothetical protein